MILKGKYYSLHRECLATAPLPDAHRKFLAKAMRAVQMAYPSAKYSVVDYDLKSGHCRFLGFDCDLPWPEAKEAFEFSDDGSPVRQVRFRKGSGPVLTDHAVILPKWSPYSVAAHAKLAATQKAKLALLKAKERPVAKLWNEPDLAKSIDWTATEGDQSPKVCSLQCDGCYLALGKGKKSERHRTAIRRFECSRPVKNALRDKLISSDLTFLDYGCGQGEDCSRLAKQGIAVQGWDPVFKPLPMPVAADVVNLGYIINVIENIQERIDTLTRAFSLAGKLLIVSAYMDNGKATRHVNAVPFGDGVITSRGTFQKLFRQKELRLFIESTLGVKANSADFGVYYVFKDEALRDRFLDHRSLTKPDQISKKRAERKPPGEVERPLLERLALVTSSLGRLPIESEFDQLPQAKRQAGSGESLQEQVFSELDAGMYEHARQRRKTDMLVHLASSRLSTRGRPRVKDLSASEKADIKVLFTTYKDACEQADELLMQLGNSEAIDEACVSFGLGKMLPDALYIHVSLEDELPILLSLMVGCARNFAERELPENVSVLKLKRDGHGVTFIESEDFFEEAHPAIIKITKVKFLRRKVIQRDFSASENPTVYHRKELFLSPDHPSYETFAALTLQEEKAGLLAEPYIGRKNQWDEVVAAAGFKIEGHELVPCPSAKSAVPS
jgi:DNA phosphorothioation-associated putative methyltransferase